MLAKSKKRNRRELRVGVSRTTRSWIGPNAGPSPADRQQKNKDGKNDDQLDWRREDVQSHKLRTNKKSFGRRPDRRSGTLCLVLPGGGARVGTIKRAGGGVRSAGGQPAHKPGHWQ